MTEMSLSSEEKGASASKVELPEPGGYLTGTCYRVYTSTKIVIKISLY